MKIIPRVLQLSHLSLRYRTYKSLNLHAIDRLRYGLQCFNRVPTICYSNLSDHDVKKRTEELTDCFMEARELMQDAVGFIYLKYELVSVICNCTKMPYNAKAAKQLDERKVKQLNI